MPVRYPARMLQLHSCERDRYKDKPLYGVMIEKCRELKIAGVTLFRGIEGHGERAAPLLEEMMRTGVVAASDVQAIRVERAGEA
jgi:PII-like signaling protein